MCPIPMTASPEILATLPLAAGPATPLAGDRAGLRVRSRAQGAGPPGLARRPAGQRGHPGSALRSKVMLASSAQDRRRSVVLVRNSLADIAIRDM